MDPSQQVNAGYYRAEARRIRRTAATVKDEAIRSQLLEIATTYEQLAAGIGKQCKVTPRRADFQNVDFESLISKRLRLTMSAEGCATISVKKVSGARPDRRELLKLLKAPTAATW